MNEDEIKQMHGEAKEVLEKIKSLSDFGKTVAINCFMNKWWGLEPSEALKIGCEPPQKK